MPLPETDQIKISELNDKIAEMEKSNREKTDEVERLKLDIVRLEEDIRKINLLLESHFLQ